LANSLTALQPTGFFTSYGQIAQAAERGEIDYNIVRFCHPPFISDDSI